MNETILHFGYPGTLIAEYRHWVVLLRPQQPTLGSLVLAAAGDFTAFSDQPAEAFAELHRAVSDIEAGESDRLCEDQLSDADDGGSPCPLARDPPI